MLASAESLAEPAGLTAESAAEFIKAVEAPYPIFNPYRVVVLNYNHRANQMRPLWGRTDVELLFLGESRGFCPQDHLSLIPSGSNPGSAEYAINHPCRRYGISYVELVPEELIIYIKWVREHRLGPIGTHFYNPEIRLHRPGSGGTHCL